MMLYILLCTSLLLCILHLIFNYNKKARMLRKIPGLKDTFLFGNTLQVMLSPVDLFKELRKWARTHTGLYRIWCFPIGMVNVYDPEDIETVISGTKFNEKSIVYKFLKPWLQEGLLVSNGEKWHQRRKILTPAFHFNILRHFFVVLEENSVRLVDTLRDIQGQAVDIVPIICEYTLNAICETAMGTRLDEQSTDKVKSYKKALNELGQLLSERFVRVYYYSDFIFNMSPLAKLQTKHLDNLHNFTGRVIEERKKYVKKYGIDKLEMGENVDDEFLINKKKKMAMLDLMIAAKKDGLIDDTGIQEEVDTFMFEGHDTTANGLLFCLMLLANHKYVQDKVVQELEDIFGESTRASSMDDLSKMRYLECCLKESMRLYPPVPFISRNLGETVQLGNHTVPAGTVCHIHIFDLHRREDLFKNAQVFDPDRFLPENSVGRHPYSYIPFSAGPRNCIGQKFAIMEMKSCVSAILRNFELIPVTRESDIELKCDIVLRTTGPVKVKFVPRNKTNH